MARRILLHDARPRMLSCKAGFYRAILLQIRSPLKFFSVKPFGRKCAGYKNVYF